ncbi:hypothetical protein KC19_9G180000 [Ceratodon purpureus]|uniref:SMP-30/Gluconolactonase/LRE-like region domain-containing protein n=1 Tax=Ceratodon purpureus TaxID=3225 RepID=A0A8T0GX90_CERPU|nr:hypothetical protein KC19_9G180000 [Ceratodon purpureus]
MMTLGRLMVGCCVLFLHLEWYVRDVNGGSLKFKALNLFPESFDWDPVHDRMLLSSMSKGTISELDTGSGTVKEFVRDEELAGKVASGGMIVDSRRNRVVHALHDIVGWRFGGVAAYDLDTGRRLFFARLDNVGVVEGELSCANDVAVDFNTGIAYVTNCRGSFLWKVTVEGTPSVFVKDESFTSQPSLFDEAPWCSFNGIVHDQNKYLLAVQTNSGALFRVDVDDRSVHLVAMEERLPGADGMVLRDDGALVIVSSRKVWLVRSTSNWIDANVVDAIPLNPSDYSTGAALKGRSTFIVHAHLPDMFANRTREEFELQEIKFPSEVPDNNHPTLLIVLVVLVVVIVLLWRLKMGKLYDQNLRKRA